MSTSRTIGVVARLTSWWFPAMGVVIGIGAVLRALQLSNGTLFRDDAWVALTSRVDLSTAWKMVGASPGFVLGMRQWVDVVGQTTWLQQLPTLIVSIAGLVALGVLARWWGLSRASTLIVVGLLAGSRIAVEYSTHLKPYSHDILMSCVLLFAAALSSRGRSPWIFTGACAIALVTSLTSLPLVLGLLVVVVVRHVRRGTVGRLVLPLAVVGVPLSGFTFVVQRGLSPRLHESWSSNFIDHSSVSGFFSSIAHIGRSVMWGLVDSTPRLGISYLGGLIVMMFVGGIVIGIGQRGRSTLLVAGPVGAVIAASAGVMPLGTGRTDTYLYVPLLLLFGLGLDVIITRIRRGTFQKIVISLILVMPIAGIYDRIAYQRPYPGGDFHAVADVVRATVQRGGNVIIEGTARWPYTYYSADHFTVKFSPNYNTGFAPVVDTPHTVVMPGSQIEGGYDPGQAVNKAYGASVILTVRADDWNVDNPLAPALTGSCYLESGNRHVPGFYLEWWKKDCRPD
ncbi:MAG: hypothetical protein KJS64_03535 [Acidobacteria bacterium]|nr:hypothetical protein [Acidobacteriota bacterium]